MEYVDSKTNNLEDLNDHDHAHVPYLLLLLHYLNKWLVSHEQKPPSTYKEKTAFRELVREGARQNNAEGGEENFDEAVGAVLKSLNPALLSSGLREVFEAEECKNLRFDVSITSTTTSAINMMYSKIDTCLSPRIFGS